MQVKSAAMIREKAMQEQSFNWVGQTTRQTRTCHGVDVTYDVEKGQDLAEEVSVGPEVVVLKVGVQVVDEQLLLLSLLHFCDDPQVEVHHEGSYLACLPVFPEPTWNVEQDCLQRSRWAPQKP